MQQEIGPKRLQTLRAQSAFLPHEFRWVGRHAGQPLLSRGHPDLDGPIASNLASAPRRDVLKTLAQDLAIGSHPPKLSPIQAKKPAEV